MHKMLNGFGRANAQHIAVFVSDVVPKVNFNDTIPEADAAEADGLQLFIISATQNRKSHVGI